MISMESVDKNRAVQGDSLHSPASRLLPGKMNLHLHMRGVLSTQTSTGATVLLKEFPHS